MGLQQTLGGEGLKSILQPRVRDFVAWQLEHYSQNKRQLEQIKKDLIPSATPNYGSAGGGHSNVANRTTEDVVIQICSPVYVQQLERTIKAIEYVLDKLDSTDEQLITLVYFQGSYTVSGAAQIVNLSQSTAYEHINKILTAIALELGLINAGY